MAYTTARGGSVWVKNLESGEERAVPGTENIIEVKFSPDGRWLLLDDLETIYRAPVAGGSPTILVDNVPTAPHSRWVSNDDIVFDRNEYGIAYYNLETGQERTVILPDTSIGHVRYLYPDVNEDQTRFIALLVGADQDLSVGIFSWPEAELLHHEPWFLTAARFVGPNHVAGVEAGNLMIRAVDNESGRFSGPPAELAESVTDMAWDITPNGILLTTQSENFRTALLGQGVAAGGLLYRGSFEEQTRDALPYDLRRWYDPDVSPDGSHLAVEIGRLEPEPGDDVWVIDFVDGVMNPLTSDNTGNEPIWTPDGDSILYVNRNAAPRSVLEIMAADGSGRPRSVYEHDRRIEYPDVSPDGSLILFSVETESDGLDVKILDTVTGSVRTAAAGSGRQSEPRFSPDGRYFTYTDQDRIKVMTTTLDGSAWDVSQGQGEHSRWSSDGRFIYFLSDAAIIRVPVDISNRFRVTGPSETQEGSITVAFTTVPGTDDLITSAVTFSNNADFGLDRVEILTNVFRRIEQLAPVR
jgi:Tol biopolymer transport system component